MAESLRNALLAMSEGSRPAYPVTRNCSVCLSANDLIVRNHAMRNVTKINMSTKPRCKMIPRRALRPVAYHIMASPPRTRPLGA